jgi:hypothetical protein
MAAPSSPLVGDLPRPVEPEIGLLMRRPTGFVEYLQGGLVGLENRPLHQFLVEDVPQG